MKKGPVYHVIDRIIEKSHIFNYMKENKLNTSITSAGALASVPAMWISLVFDVIFSMAHMNTSEMIEIPKKL